MSEQRTLASVAYDTKGKVTRRERFLREMDAVIPWSRLFALIEPHYTKPGRGRRPLPLKTMLRVYFLQQWFDLSDPQAEDMLYDSEAMRRFARVELGEDTVPDESTILRFRHLLEEHQLTAAMFEAVKQLLEEKRLLLKILIIEDDPDLGFGSRDEVFTQSRQAVVEATPPERAVDANEHSNKCHRATIRSQAQRSGDTVLVASLYTPVWHIAITTLSPS